MITKESIEKVRKDVFQIIIDSGLSIDLRAHLALHLNKACEEIAKSIEQKETAKGKIKYEYFTAVATNTYDLDSIVTEKMNNGWDLWGNQIVVLDSNRDVLGFYQGMVKYE